MSMTRRGFVYAGVIGLSAMAAPGCRKNEPQEKSLPDSPHSVSPTDVSDDCAFLYTVRKGASKGLLTVFEGLCAFIASPDFDAMDVALLSTEDLRKLKTLSSAASDHYPTLVVPRSAVMGGTAKPVAADVKHAYYSLDKMNVTIGPGGGSTGKAELFVNRKTLTTRRREDPRSCSSHPGCCPQEGMWNNFDWLLDFTRELHNGTLAKDWRERRGVVRAIIKLRAGTIEDASLSEKEKGGSRNVRVWQLNGTKRALKEVVRHTLEAQSYKVTLEPFDGSAPKEIILGANGSIEMCVAHLPVPFMGGHVDRLEDLWANYLLLEGGAALLRGPKDPPIPELADDVCHADATSECGCCPSTRFIDYNWSEV